MGEIIPLHDRILAEMEERKNGAPEGVSFFIVTTDPDIAQRVAPLLAAELEPDRRFGRVLHVEPVTAERVEGIEVVLEAL